MENNLKIIVGGLNWLPKSPEKSIVWRNLYFLTKQTADDVLSAMKFVLELRGYVTLDDLYEKIGVDSGLGHKYIGWTGLDGVVVRETTDNLFYIDFINKPVTLIKKYAEAEEAFRTMTPKLYGAYLKASLKTKGV